MCKYCEDPAPNGVFPHWYSPDGMYYYYLEAHDRYIDEGCKTPYILRVGGYDKGPIWPICNVNNCPICGRKLYNV